jgi:hypothetical protein
MQLRPKKEAALHLVRGLFWLSGTSRFGFRSHPISGYQLYTTQDVCVLQDLFARGSHFKPHPIIGYLLGGRRDFAFGIYGRSNEARRLLQHKWAGEVFL